MKRDALAAITTLSCCSKASQPTLGSIIFLCPAIFMITTEDDNDHYDEYITLFYVIMQRRSFVLSMTNIHTYM